MKRISLAIIAAAILLLVGCTINVNDRSDFPKNQAGSTTDNTTGSLTDGSDFTKTNTDGTDNMINEKIECAGSYITDVYSNISLDEENSLEKAEYKIVQGKDGTKYSAELKCDKEEYAYTFTVNNESGKNLLSLTTYASYYGDVFEILDLNMDGYADIKFLTSEGALNSVYDFYIWDAGVKEFIKAECDDELLFVDLEVVEGYLKLWSRNDASSGFIEKYEWDGNRLVNVSVEEYYADDEASGESSEWKFTRDDIKIDEKDILGITYEQLVKTFGEPIETKTYKVNPPATEPDYFEYFYVCVYDGFECEFSTGEIEKSPEPTDTVFRFDITSDKAQLDCELYIGIDTEELDLRYSINKIYKLNDTESYDLNNIKHVLESYKTEGYYSEYDRAAIVYHDPESFEEPLAKALVILFDDDRGGEENRVQRIVFGYPTAD